MALEVLKKCEYTEEGAFSRVDYTNLLEFLIGNGLETEWPHIKGKTILHPKKTGIVSESRTDFIAGGVKLCYFIRPPSRKTKGLVYCTLRGNKKRISEVRNILLKTLEQGSYIPD